MDTAGRTVTDIAGDDEPAKARLAEIGLPSFGEPDARARAAGRPAIPDVSTPFARGRPARRYDAVVVYADREHSAIAVVSHGFDPRFEEAILIVGPGDGEPAILVGNECWGLAGAAPLPMRRELFQDLSLPSQPRDRSRPLADHPRR